MSNLKNYLQFIDPVVVSKYLISQNWTKITDVNNVYQQFLTPSKDDAVVIPFAKEYVDYDNTLINALQTISNYSNLSVSSLVNILTSPPSDILKLRIHNRHTNLGTIQLSNIANMIESIKNSLATTAIDIMEPQSFHKKVLTKDIKRLLETYSLGQTERGSYILNLLCPLGETQLEFFEDPISRRVNEKLLSSITNIQNDLEANNQSKIEEEIEQKLYSVNFLESILDLNEAAGETGLDISAHWNTYLPMENDVPSIVSINPKYIENIGIIAEKLKPTTENSEQRFYGKISNIEANPEVSNRDDVKIVVATINANEKKVNLSISLNYNTFPEVTRAFENGLTVNVKGLLISQPRKKTLENCDFQVMED